MPEYHNIRWLMMWIKKRTEMSLIFELKASPFFLVYFVEVENLILQRFASKSKLVKIVCYITFDKWGLDGKYIVNKFHLNMKNALV